MVNVLTEYPGVTEMATGSRSEVYWDLLFGQGLSSTGMSGRLKARLTQSTEKVLLNQS